MQRQVAARTSWFMLYSSLRQGYLPVKPAGYAPHRVANESHTATDTHRVQRQVARARLHPFGSNYRSDRENTVKLVFSRRADDSLATTRTPVALRISATAKNAGRFQTVKSNQLSGGAV